MSSRVAGAGVTMEESTPAKLKRKVSWAGNTVRHPAPRRDPRGEHATVHVGPYALALQRRLGALLAKPAPLSPQETWKRAARAQLLRATR